MKVFPAEQEDIAMDLGQPVSLAVSMLLRECTSWARAEVTDRQAQQSQLQDCRQSGL